MFLKVVCVIADHVSSQIPVYSSVNWHELLENVVDLLLFAKSTLLFKCFHFRQITLPYTL